MEFLILFNREEMIRNPETGEPVRVEVIYTNGAFCVNKSIGSATYDVTHVGTTAPVILYLNKANAIKLCDEFYNAGITDISLADLLANKTLERAYKIVQDGNYRYLSNRRKPKEPKKC